MARWLSDKEKEMIANLFSLGLNCNQISKKTKINPSVVRYWRDNKTREQVKKTNRDYNLNMTPEQRRARFVRNRDYVREYHRERYNSDEEFRERIKRHVRKWQEKKKKKNQFPNS